MSSVSMPGIPAPINEATLEARVHALLDNIFPTFREVKLVHQQSFTLKFGHNDITINSVPSNATHKRGRFDILLTIEDENVILLELKQEGLPLFEDDVDQGISYARFMHPMPPVTVISNGRETWLYNTYTKEKFESMSMDEAFLKKVLDNSFTLSKSNQQNAIELLLGKDHTVFSQIVTSLSEEKFTRLIGDLGDLDKPICREFSIKRSLADVINQQFTKGESLVGVIGSAFSGKTTLLYQIFEEMRSGGHFVYFIDCYDDNFSIFQELANHFSIFTGITVSTDKVRAWLLNSVLTSQDSKFYLIIDNFNKDLADNLRQEIFELIKMFRGGKSYTVYATDELNFLRLAYTKERKLKTTVGDQTKLLQLEEFSDAEFESITNNMFNQYRVSIDYGGHFASEYRQPRILRQLTKFYFDPTHTDRYSRIIAVPDPDHMNVLGQSPVYSDQILEQYAALIKQYLSEEELRDSNIFLQSIASGTGSVTVDGFKHTYPKLYKRISRSSLIVKRRVKRTGEVLYPKIPELVAQKSVAFLIARLLEHYTEGESEKIYHKYMKLISSFPYSDLVGATIILELIRKQHTSLVMALIDQLLNNPPAVEPIRPGTKAMMYDEHYGNIQINFADGMDEDDGGFVSNFLPYAVLSQVAGYPFELIKDNSDDHPLTGFLHMLYHLGSSDELLLRADPRSFTNMRSIQYHTFKGVGKIISSSEGIIEPIVQSIQKCFMSLPAQMSVLINDAFDKNNFPFLWRVLLCTRNLLGIADASVAGNVSAFIKRFNPYFNQFMADFLSKGISDDDERNKIREKLLRMKFNVN